MTTTRLGANGLSAASHHTLPAQDPILRFNSCHRDSQRCLMLFLIHLRRFLQTGLDFSSRLTGRSPPSSLLSRHGGE